MNHAIITIITDVSTCQYETVKGVFYMINLRLEDIIKQTGYSRTAIADITKITRSALVNLSLHQVESIRLDSIEKICKGLNVTPNELFDIRNEDGSLWSPAPRVLVSETKTKKKPIDGSQTIE
jgi:DNA-binding Xre family transcriptional regulator